MRLVHARHYSCLLLFLQHPFGTSQCAQKQLGSPGSSPFKMVITIVMLIIVSRLMALLFCTLHIDLIDVLCTLAASMHLAQAVG